MEEIEAARTPRGGFTRAQLAEWGVPWPPPRAWRDRLAAFTEADGIAAHMAEIQQTAEQFGSSEAKPIEHLAVKLSSVQECRREVGPDGFRPVLWINFIAEDKLLKLAIDRKDLGRIVACLLNSEAAKLPS